MGEPHERLRAARKAAGFKSARAAALRYHWTPSTYASHENGQTPLPVDAASRYARAFKVSPAWLLTGEGEMGKHSATLAGQVGAGAEIVPVPDDEPIDRDVELPPGGTPDLNVVIVRGESMYPRYFDGERIYYRPEHRSPDELLGKECVVQLRDGRILVKRLRKGSRKNVYTLESYNAPSMEDVQIEWATPVRWRG